LVLLTHFTTTQLITNMKHLSLLIIYVFLQLSLFSQNTTLLEFWQKKDWTNLIRISNEQIQANKADYQAYYWKQYALLEQGDYNKAIEVLQAALASCENKVEIRSELANLYFQKGMYLQAKTELDTLLKQTKPEFRTIKQRVLIHEFSKERLAAISLLYRGRNMDATQAFYWIHLGDNLKQLGEYDDAIMNYESALALNPLDYQTSSELARVYLMDSPKLALEICQKVLEQDSTNVRFIQIAASAHVKLEEDGEALAQYEKAMCLGDSCINTIRNAGILCHKTYKQDKAIKLLTKAYNVDSTDVKVVFYLGMAETHFLNIDRGLELFDESLQLLQPDSVILSIIHKEMATIFKDKENHQLALEHYLIAHRFNPEKKFYLFLIAEQFDALDKKKEALDYYQQVYDGIDEKEGMDLLTVSVRDYSKSRIEKLKEDLFMEQ